MYNKLSVTLILILSISVISFAQDNAYSFFAAGHLYGAPGVHNVGFHPPFKAKYEYIQGREEIEFGVLLGDIVIYGAEDKWDNVVADIDTLGIPCHIAVGNHDMKNPEFFYDEFGETTYYSFSHKNDLFIILDPNIDSWNISGEQLTFLQNTLNSEASNHDIIFVMMHQLLWWAPDNQYAGIVINSTEGRADEINFWTEIEPLFHELDNRVIMCAGDIGAAYYSSDFMYDNYDNITYIATGMGKGDPDNFLIVNVDDNKNVDYELICLNNEELYCFGDLEDYEISKLDTNSLNTAFCLYPNPTKDIVSITGLKSIDCTIEIYNLQGESVYKIRSNNKFEVQIDCSQFPNAIYFVKINSAESSEILRFVKI